MVLRLNFTMKGKRNIVLILEVHVVLLANFKIVSVVFKVKLSTNQETESILLFTSP